MPSSPAQARDDDPRPDQSMRVFLRSLRKPVDDTRNTHKQCREQKRQANRGANAPCGKEKARTRSADRAETEAFAFVYLPTLLQFCASFTHAHTHTGNDGAQARTPHTSTKRNKQSYTSTHARTPANAVNSPAPLLTVRRRVYTLAFTATHTHTQARSIGQNLTQKYFHKRF